MITSLKFRKIIGLIAVLFSITPMIGIFAFGPTNYFVNNLGVNLTTLAFIVVADVLIIIMSLSKERINSGYFIIYIIVYVIIMMMVFTTYPNLRTLTQGQFYISFLLSLLFFISHSLFAACAFLSSDDERVKWTFINRFFACFCIFIFYYKFSIFTYSNCIFALIGVLSSVVVFYSKRLFIMAIFIIPFLAITLSLPADKSYFSTMHTVLFGIGQAVAVIGFVLFIIQFKYNYKHFLLPKLSVSKEEKENKKLQKINKQLEKQAAEAEQKEKELALETKRNEKPLKKKEASLASEAKEKEIVIPKQEEMEEQVMENINIQKDNILTVKEISASAHTGIGLFTSICLAFANIGGVESKNYVKKMNKIKQQATDDLILQCAKLKFDEIIDIRYVLSGLSVIAYAKAIKYKTK